MEIISTIALLSLFSFFYFLGRKDTDYPLELLGAFGILFMGILVVALQLTAFHINDTGVIYLKQIPGTNGTGWIIFFIGFMLMMLSIRTLIRASKKGVLE
jgi:hypothetical protein